MTRLKFQNEDHLQASIEGWLKTKGYTPQREVPVYIPGNSKTKHIDVLTESHIIEAKMSLTYSWFHHAMGQLTVYKTQYPGRKLVIAGLYPANESQSVASANAARHAGYEVWYLEDDPSFVEFCLGKKTSNQKYHKKPNTDEYDLDSIFNIAFPTTKTTRRKHYNREPDWKVWAAAGFAGLMMLGAISGAQNSGQFNSPVAPTTRIAVPHSPSTTLPRNLSDLEKTAQRLMASPDPCKRAEGKAINDILWEAKQESLDVYSVLPGRIKEYKERVGCR